MAYRSTVANRKRNADPASAAAGATNAAVPTRIGSNNAFVESAARKSSMDGTTTECVIQQYMGCTQYLPQEVKRCLTLLKDLNGKYNRLVDELQSLQNQYIENARTRLRARGGGASCEEKKEIVMLGDPDLMARIEAKRLAL